MASVSVGSCSSQGRGSLVVEITRTRIEGGAGMGSSLDGGSERHDACIWETKGCEFYTPYSCSAGTVSVVVDPCGFCGPTSWKPVHRCERGCRIDLSDLLDASYTPFGTPEELCEENRPKNAGEAGF